MNLLARLVIQAEGQGALLLRVGQYAIGRSIASDLYLEHRTVSRQHATIVISPTPTLTLTDHGSRNGTFVNGDPVKAVELLPCSATLTFGSVVCALEWFAPPSDDETEYSTEAGMPPNTPIDLTAAEERVFTLLLGGFTEKTIATKLHLSKHTVHTHVKRIYKLYGIHTRAELLSTCLRMRPRE
jgi:DNA-binding CsgD family transcriptional regulator